jgi:hypothetical protein
MPACDDVFDRNMGVLDDFTSLFNSHFPFFYQYSHGRPFSLYYTPCQEEVDKLGFEINQAIMLLLGVMVDWVDLLVKYIPLYKTLPLPKRRRIHYHRIELLFDFYIGELSRIKKHEVGEENAEQIGLFFWDVFEIDDSLIEEMDLNNVDNDENKMLHMILLMNGCGARLSVKRTLAAFMWAKTTISLGS